MSSTITPYLADTLRRLADQYEKPDFIVGDPSWFMHQVRGRENQEVTAFIAQAVSYGSRKQFMPKIQRLLDASDGNMASWVSEGAFIDMIPRDDGCFYRLYNNRMFNSFLTALQSMLRSHGSIGDFIHKTSHDALSACESLTGYFLNEGSEGIIPRNTKSSCKRLCMFLRWMSRTESPVDLGLWKDFIDRRTLIMPMDVHVMRQSNALGLLKAASASMTTARRLTDAMLEVFPDDPLKGDFALFGLGIDEANRATKE
ncbi:MAG: TIGR02757 family protein [Prevotella sp.]|nr:TIGR02757 family protein [Prevotella sp.]MDY4653763.1 TIGR02757 family protein [Prevotella sp.]